MAYYQRHLKTIKEKRHQYYLSHKKEFEARNKSYPRELVHQWQRNFRKRNKKKILKYQREWYQKSREGIIYQLGGRCVICGENNIRFLHLDRIKGGKHRRDIGWLTKNVKEFQVLCANHHNEKTIYGFCMSNTEMAQ